MPGSPPPIMQKRASSLFSTPPEKKCTCLPVPCPLSEKKCTCLPVPCPPIPCPLLFACPLSPLFACPLSPFDK